MSEYFLPQDWNEMQLGELGVFFRGRGGTRADEEENGLPCVRYGDLYTHHGCIIRSFCSAISHASASKYTRLQNSDIVFAGSGETFEEIGKAAAYCGEGQAYVGGDTIIFRPRSNFKAHFAGYAVNSTRANQYKSRMGQGSSVIHISAEHLSCLPLKLPPVVQQQRIAKVLLTIDQAIEKTEDLIHKYQLVKAGLMHDLFSRGLTVDGKFRPPREQAPELYQETSIGWIPKGWGTQTINDLLQNIIDYRGKTPLKTISGIPLITARNVRKGYIDPEPQEFIAQDDYSSWMTRGIPQPTDVLFTTEAPLGNVAQIGTSERVAFAQRIIILQPLPSVRPTLLKYRLMTDQFQREVEKKASGTTALGIKQSEFRKLQLCFPKCQIEQEKMENYLVSVDERLKSEIAKSNKLLSLKHGLMHDLLTGKVPVKIDQAEAAHV